MFLEKGNGAGLPLTRQTEASCVRAALVPGREMLLVTLCGNRGLVEDGRGSSPAVTESSDDVLLSASSRLNGKWS